MRRRIMIEIEAEECIVEKVTQEIEAAAVGQFAARKLTGFQMYKEELPERLLHCNLRVPQFLVNRPFSDCARADCKERLYEKGDDAE